MSLPPVDGHSTSSYSYEHPLPPMARTNAVTQVPPAKKITFYKSGDPQFGGIKMAINQRSFKSFNALMDDLSNRVPLPFGVRAITTPRGIHFISTLDQLEDGGCYLCSDKKYVTPLNIGVASRRLGPQKIRWPASAFKRVAQDIKQEDYTMAFTQQSPKIPKKITLIKNGDIATQFPIILNRRNAQSFRVLLDEISEIMQFTVRKLYTVDGKRIDSVQGLLLCPSVLICVGQEPFKPLMMQNPKKRSLEKLPGLASHSDSNPVGKKNEMNFGLKAKKSVIHPRSSLSNRSMRFSLSSEKSYINGPATSPENGIPSLNNCPHSKGEDLVPSLVNDDIEKKVYMNKDGSLSVEMKVRFHLLTDETLQWSTQIKKSSLMNQTPCEESDVREGNQIEPREKINQETSFEMDDSLYPCDADSYISNLDESENETYCHCCSKPHSNYDIWKNPMHVSQKEEPGITNTWYTHSSCSSTSSHQKNVHKKKASIDSIHTLSSESKHSELIIQETSDYSDTLGNKIKNGRIKNCCCLQDYIQKNTSQKEVSEEMDGVGSLTSSENEDDSIMRKERDESKGSRARSNKSKFQYSIESQIQVLEETSSVIRTISSCSIKEREEVIGCSSSPNSACSKSSKCRIFGTKDKLGNISDNDHRASSYDKIPSSFSSDDCSPKIVTQVEGEKDGGDNSEINSTAENMVSNHLIKDEVSKCGRNSRNRFFQSKVCNEDDRRSDSSEMDMHSVAFSASRIFSRSKCNQNYSKGDSKVSGESSRGSIIKKKKTKGPLHVETGNSSSRMMCYSENSNEVEKRDKEGQISHNSNSPNSNVSSLNEAAASNEENVSRISKCYSKSSKSSPKRSQIEDTNKLSSPVSNFLESDRTNGAGTAKISTQANTSRQGNISEPMCPKCGHIAETRSLLCASSRILLDSDAKSTCSEMQASENNDVSSPSSIAQSSKPRQKKRGNVHDSLQYCSEVSETASATLYNFHSPIPPRGRPSSKNSQSLLMNINSALLCTELEPTADELQKEMADSQLPEMDKANEAENNLDLWKEKGGSWQEKRQVEEDAVAKAEAAAENYDQIIPSSLPNASPEEVVHEWLRKMPSESLLIKCKMQKDEEKIELHAEVPGCSNKQESLEEEFSEKEVTEDCEKLAEKEHPQEKASEMISEEAETNQRECHYNIIQSQNNHKKDLPNTIQISVQIMKILLASRHEAKLDRSYSLPEVSPTLGRKLSNSANTLIQCLASLQLLDEELDPSNKQNKSLNWFRYKELLNIFQAVWFGNTSEKGGTNSELQGKGQMKASSGFKAPNSKYGDFTPMTSSGIDVSSGDGGSGEESGVGAHDYALLKEKRDKAKSPEEGKPEEEDSEEHEEESEEHSQPRTLCSKLESEKQPELAGVQEVIEAKVDQVHENSKDKELDKNCRHDDQNVDGAENDSNADNVLMESHTDTMAKEIEKNPSEEYNEEAGKNETEADSSINETIDEKELQINSEKQFVNKDDTESSNISHQTAVEVSSMIQQRSISPDPVWVLKLLKKIEKEFMTHYVSAMNELRVKWNLPNSEELDLMIAELKEEVSSRIQKTVQKELNKIRSRAGQKIPKPPENELRHKSTPELENRRRRLTSMLSLNNINDQSTNLNNQLDPRDLSYNIDKDDFLYSTIQDDGRYDDQLRDEEYCPCDVCIQKKMVAKAAQRTVVVMARAPTPVMKAFDLQEILRMNKTNVAHRKAEHDISELGQEEEAEQATKETVEGEAEQEAKCDEAKEADGIKEQKVQEANEDEALEDSERVFKNQNYEEEEEEEEAVKEEENKGEEKSKKVDEEEGWESVKEDEKEESAKQEGEETKEEKNEKESEKEMEEDKQLGESKNEKEDEEQEKEVKEEQAVEQGENDVISEENNQEMEAKSEGDKELNSEEEMDEEQKETQKEHQEAEDEPNMRDKTNSAVEMGERESQGEEPAENLQIDESQAVIEEGIPASGGDKFENNASSEARCEACSETAEVEEEDENKEHNKAGENEAEGEDSNESVQNTEDDRGTEENGATEGPEILRKGTEGIFSQQSQNGSQCKSDGDVSKDKENIGNEDGDCGSDGEAKLFAESKHAKMYPDSNDDDEDQSSQASIVMGEDPQNEENEGSHQVSKKKEQNSKTIDQEDLDF